MLIKIVNREIYTYNMIYTTTSKVTLHVDNKILLFWCVICVDRVNTRLIYYNIREDRYYDELFSDGANKEYIGMDSSRAMVSLAINNTKTILVFINGKCLNIVTIIRLIKNTINKNTTVFLN